MAELPKPECKDPRYGPHAVIPSPEALLEELRELDDCLKVDQFVDASEHMALERSIFRLPIAFVDTIVDRWGEQLNRDHAAVMRAVSLTGSRLAMTTSYRLNQQHITDILPSPPQLNFWSLYFADSDYLEAGIQWTQGDPVMAPLLEQVFEDPEEYRYAAAAAGIILTSVSLTIDQSNNPFDESVLQLFKTF